MPLSVTPERVNELRDVINALAPFAIQVFEGFVNRDPHKITEAIVNCVLEANKQGLMD